MEIDRIWFSELRQSTIIGVVIIVPLGKPMVDKVSNSLKSLPVLSQSTGVVETISGGNVPGPFIIATISVWSSKL